MSQFPRMESLSKSLSDSMVGCKKFIQLNLHLSLMTHIFNQMKLFFIATGVDLNSLKQHDRTCEDIAMLPYSSGTTGLSKGVKLSHKNIVCNSMMINSDTGNGQLTYEAIGDYQDSLPCVLPFFHIYGLTCCLLSKLAHGCKLVALKKFQPEPFLNALVNYKPTVLYLVPPISEYLFKIIMIIFLNIS